MRKIILDLAVSLDGFIEGPGGEVDWCIMDEEMGFVDFLAGVDTILYGRVSYDLWGNYQPGVQASPAETNLWKAVHQKKKVVFSKQPRQDKHATWMGADIADRVAKLKQEPGNDIWLYGGSNLIMSFINLQLVDIFRLSVHPIILGSGKPLFAGIHNRVPLSLTRATPFTSGVTLLQYSTLKSNANLV